MRVDKSNWRLPGNNGERSNNRNEFWTGKSIFRVLKHQEVLPVASCSMDDNLVACVNTMGLDIISPNQIFIPHTYPMVIEENMQELPEGTPTMVLMCLEPSSLMTKRYREIMDTPFHLELITEDDDLLSRYGSAKWRRCLRSNKDCVFFAGPCTGGSPWNRLHKRVSNATAHDSCQSTSLLEVMGRVFKLLIASDQVGCHGPIGTA